MKPSYERQMGVSEQRSRRWAELLMAGLFKAQVEPRSLVLGLRFPTHLLDLISAADRAPDYAIGPAHLLDVLKAMLFGGELYVQVADIDGLRVLSLCHA